MVGVIISPLVTQLDGSPDDLSTRNTIG